MRARDANTGDSEADADDSRRGEASIIIYNSRTPFTTFRFALQTSLLGPFPVLLAAHD